MTETRSHPMQRLTEIPVTGPVPETDPEYGIVWTIVDNVDMRAGEIRDEVDFDGIRTDADGTVHLTLSRYSDRYKKGDRLGSVRTSEDVARVAMTDRHADARLVVMDPVR